VLIGGVLIQGSRAISEVGNLAQPQSVDARVRELAEIETRVRFVVADLGKGDAGNFMMQLDLQQRVAIERRAQKAADAYETRIGQGADADLACQLALQRACVIAQPLRRGEDFARARQDLLTGKRQCHAAGRAIE
jgi:hypothetical protein